MFNGSVPIILDSLKQHYFIDRDGKMFRHILNFLRVGILAVPENFREIDLLLEEARFFELSPLIRAIENLKRTGPNSTTAAAAAGASRHANGLKSSSGGCCSVDCVAMNVSPDLGERISLSADRVLLEEVFPELSAALMDFRGAAWNLDNRFVIRFPVNGYCKLNSLQVMQRLLGHGFEICASNGAGVEGQQFSEYVFCKRRDSVPPPIVSSVKRERPSD